ncbi:hypothetical protein TNCV_524341 [Trichonephila clavipes]|nr:hypothetical protein TNCV_524341 [Trichonephila clavipes]
MFLANPTSTKTRNRPNLRKYGETNIVRTIKASRIRWLGHLYRYADAFPTKKVTFRKLKGPDVEDDHLHDGVEKDLKLMGTNR